MRDISIQDYNYSLPEDRIAKYPLNNREDSKLLIYSNEKIKSSTFRNIVSEIPSNSLLIFNETKVVHARLFLRKNTGATIEVFVLEPYDQELQEAYQQKKKSIWKCMIGNAKRWKDSPLYLKTNEDVVTLKKVGSSDNLFLIEFTWTSNLTFIELLEKFGNIPLPPYLNRDAEEDDKIRYQTVYAKNEGSVAAPTAGLHFTDKIIHQLKERGVASDAITLHVGAGTFKPVNQDNISQHQMHTEDIIISLKTIKHLYQQSERTFTPIGTTSVRSLESMYWYAVKLSNQHEDTSFSIPQWFPYNSYKHIPNRKEAFEIIIDYMNKNELNILKGKTQLIIMPGYKYRMTDAIITNFHQPKSTLLLLVSAFVGDDWKKIYNYALENDFRFLSYGDSCYLKSKI